MIHAILAFLENGTLIFEHYFDRFDMDGTLISGFTTAINQFGLKIFPEEDLEDIVFSKHHIYFINYKIVDQGIIFLLIHDKNEPHINMKKIAQEIYWELKQKYSHVFAKPVFDVNQLLPLRDKIEGVFTRERRAEKTAR